MLAGISLNAFGATCVFDADRMAVVNGQRTFILGLYDSSDIPGAHEAGFNLVQVTGKPDHLKTLAELGMWGWVNTGSWIDLSVEPEQRMAAMTAEVERMQAEPAMLVWEVPDEALWNCWYGPHCWRNGEEPRKLREAINALADKALAESLDKDLAQARELWKSGDYAASEALADGIWQRMGKESPNPGYGVSNAPERAAKMCAGMMQGYEKLRALDQNHPVWMNHAPRNQIAQLAAFGKAADAAGCDIYPVPFSPKVGHSDLLDRTLSSVGAYTDRMQESIPGKPVWMVLQGFGWSDIQEGLSEADKKELRRPTYAESRFMAFDAIVHGARGLLYWGTFAVEKGAPFWTDLAKVIQELRDLQPVISAPDAELKFEVMFEETSGSVDRAIRVLPKQVGDQVWFLVVNEWTEPLVYTLVGMKKLKGIPYADTATGVTASVQDGGGLHLRIGPHAVQVLKPGK